MPCYSTPGMSEGRRTSALYSLPSLQAFYTFRKQMGFGAFCLIIVRSPQGDALHSQSEKLQADKSHAKRYQEYGVCSTLGAGSFLVHTGLHMGVLLRFYMCNRRLDSRRRCTH